MADRDRDEDETRLRRIRMGTGAVYRFPFPGAPGVLVGIRALSEPELADAREAVQLRLEGHARQLGVTPGRFLGLDPEWLQAQLAREVLARAAVDVTDPSRPFFPSLDDVGRLDEVTVEALVALWHQTQGEVSPPERGEAGRAIFEALLEGGPELEHIRAAHAEGLRAYYGQEHRRLTKWQVALYAALVAKHTRGELQAQASVMTSSLAKVFAGGRPRPPWRR